MSQPADIAAWLTAIWDEQETAAREEVEMVAEYFPADRGYSWKYRWSRQIWHGGLASNLSTMPGAPSPTEVLARIAADRQILAMYIAYRDAPERMVDVRADSWWRALDEVVRLLALPHAARPGYNENWRPARLP